MVVLLAIEYQPTFEQKAFPSVGKVLAADMHLVSSEKLYLFLYLESCIHWNAKLFKVW